MHRGQLVAAWIVAAILLGMLSTPPATASPTVWNRSNFPTGAGHIIESSPIIVDVDGDGQKEIIVGTTAQQCAGGQCSSTAPTRLIVMNPDGSIQWSRDTAAPIQSSPAAGDLDGDGDLEIVVSVGGHSGDEDHDGGVIAYDRLGNQLWRFRTQKEGTAFSKGVYSTPALCDANGDGKLEIAFGGWDHRIYLLDHNGASLWNDLNWPGAGYYNADTIWSSPSCADLNRDGDREIIIGADITGGGYLPDGTFTQDGGFLYVFERTGRVLVRRYLPEAIYSSPAVGDLQGDGSPEIVVGTSWFWWNAHGRQEQPYVYVFSTTAVFDGLHYSDPAKLPNLPGWPQPTDYPGFSSPALADLDGNGDQEIIIGAGEPYRPAQAPDYLDGAGSVYAWHHTGDLVSGWPIYPTNRDGANAQIKSSPVVADVDNDGALEILFSMAWDIQVYNPNGSYQTRLDTQYTVVASPAVGDADGNGRVEVWIGSGYALEESQGYLWRFESSAAGYGNQPWPVFRRTAQHLGEFLVAPKLTAAPQNLYILHPSDHPAGQDTERTRYILSNPSDTALDWVIAGQPSTASAQPPSGRLAPWAQVVVDVTVQTSSYAEGRHSIGEIVTSAASAEGLGTQELTAPLQIRIPIELCVCDIQEVFLPLVATR